MGVIQSKNPLQGIKPKSFRFPVSMLQHWTTDNSVSLWWATGYHHIHLRGKEKKGQFLCQPPIWNHLALIYEKVFFLLTKKQKIKATLATFLRGNLWLGNCEAWYGRRALQACSPTWSTGYKKKTIVRRTTWLWLFCVALYITFTTSVSQRHSEIIIIIIIIIIKK